MYIGGKKMKEQEWNNVMEFLKEKEKRFIEDFNIAPMIRDGCPLEIIELLIIMGNPITCSRLLFQAILNRRLSDTIQTMELLKKYGINFNNEYAAEILYAFIEKEKFITASFLIDNGADVHWKDNAIIKMAISEAKENEYYYEILKALFNAKTY